MNPLEEYLNDDSRSRGQARVINGALPLLQRSPSPRIVNVSTNMASLALRTGPIMSAYAR